MVGEKAVVDGPVKPGELLRKKRVDLNLSLKDVENATSIRSTYLQALEDGEMQRIISPVYAQGFFKQYAAFVGLDGESLIRENPDLFARPDAQEFHYGIGTLEGRGNLGTNIKLLPNWLIGASFFLIILTAWFLAKFLEVI